MNPFRTKENRYNKAYNMAQYQHYYAYGAQVDNIVKTLAILSNRAIPHLESVMNGTLVAMVAIPFHCFFFIPPLGFLKSTPLA